MKEKIESGELEKIKPTIDSGNPTFANRQSERGTLKQPHLNELDQGTLIQVLNQKRNQEQMIDIETPISIQQPFNEDYGGATFCRLGSK